MERKSGRLRWVVAAVLAALVVIAVVAVPGAIERAVRRTVLPRLSTKLGAAVTANTIDAGWGRIELRDVTIGAFFQAPRITVHFGLGAALLGDLDVLEVVVQAPAIAIEIGPDGASNADVLLAQLRSRLAGDAASAAATPAASTRLPKTLRIEGGELRVSDRRHDGLLRVEGIELNLAPRGRTGTGTLAIVAATTPYGQRLALSNVALALTAPDDLEIKIADGEVELWPGFAVTNVKGTMGAQARQSVTLALGGSYGGANEPLWTAAGTLDLTTWQGEATIGAKQFALARLAAVLPAEMFPRLEQTLLDASLTLSLRDQRLAYQGAAHVQGLSLRHHMLASETLADLTLAAQFDGWLDGRGRELVLREARLVSNEVPLILRGEVAFANASRVSPEGVPQPRPRLSAHAFVPQTPCQQVLEAIPSAIAPFLREFKLQGNFAAEVDLAIDWNNLDALALRADIGLDKCEVKQAPRAVGERLKGEFTHHVEIEKDQWTSFVVGPSNPDFVAYAALPPHVVYAAMTTEDPRFLRHHGFLPSEFEKALAENLKAGYFRLGASSMTMQLVKNVLLYREKTLSRKFQELVLTWHLEQVLTKERMLEIYFNVVEYGPGIYGVTAAAREYFAKPVAALTLKEAVFLAKLLPSPKARYRQLCEGTLRKWMEDGIAQALGRMLQKTWITPNEYAAAMATPLVFATRDESREQCLARVKTAIEKARPTSPRAPPTATP